MNTDQALDLLKTGVIQGVLVPLGAALVAGIASGLQEKLSAGIQSRSDRSKLEFHRQRMETIKELLTETASSIRNRQRARLQGELNLIAAELPLLSHRRAAAKRSQADVLGWQRLPRWRRIFTLPRPRSLQGFMATGLFFWFLYLSALTIITSTNWASIREAQNFSHFSCDYQLNRAAGADRCGVSIFCSASWHKKGYRELEKAQSAGKSTNASGAIVSSSALAIAHLVWRSGLACDLGLGVTLWLYWGLVHQTFAIELHFNTQRPLSPDHTVCILYSFSNLRSKLRHYYARKSVRSLRRTGLSW